LNLKIKKIVTVQRISELLQKAGSVGDFLEFPIQTGCTWIFKPQLSLHHRKSALPKIEYT